jgi:lipopolysaccharide transport system ATP-binding protein
MWCDGMSTQNQMSNIAIRVDGLSKQYKIGLAKRRHDTLRDELTDALTSILRFNGNGSAPRAQRSDSPDTFWAIKDVSFEVKKGEVLGIIGRNGAGKSTLLKILSRITEPTEGRAEFHGRVGSLLEVGTGFHGELTGRENVYLNGAILGMKKTEIDRKFDEIVAFAEIEKFIDTPAKRYSSGMYVRLAFAVAAHLEPEILIVDEVLGVGDATFQKKCFSKMGKVAKEGRTVLFVSHNMPSVTGLCERILLLQQGRLLIDGPSHKVVAAYLSSGVTATGEREWADAEQAPGGEVARLRAVRVRTEDGCITDVVDIRRPVLIEMEYDVLKPGYRLMPNFQFYNDEGIHLFSAHDVDRIWRGRRRPVGRYISTVELPGNFLSDGSVFVGACLETVAPVIYQFEVSEAVVFQVTDTLDGDSARADYAGPMGGVIRPLLKWSTRSNQD